MRGKTKYTVLALFNLSCSLAMILFGKYMTGSPNVDEIIYFGIVLEVIGCVMLLLCTLLALDTIKMLWLSPDHYETWEKYVRAF